MHGRHCSKMASSFFSPPTSARLLLPHTDFSRRQHPILSHKCSFTSFEPPSQLRGTSCRQLPLLLEYRTSICFTDQSRSSSFLVRGLLPVDPWAPTVDSQSIASQLFAVSLFPYLGFLYFITKSKTAPKLTLFGFYFLLAFVGATSKLLLSSFSSS